MPDPKSQHEVPRKGNRIAIGAADGFPVVLVEATGAIGVLVAERRCPDETLERVLYFRSLMGQPYARFFEAVELLTVDGFAVARPNGEESIFFEPSSIPYAIENISQSQYECFVDDVVNHRCHLVEQFVIELFSANDDFGVGAEGRLIPPLDYANAMDEFMASHSFVEPHEPIKKSG